MSRVRRVTLYKHGVGYFEVGHEVEGSGEVHLNFKIEEMNEVLKSLTVHDPQGTVLSVSYDSHKDIAQLLQEIALELPKQGGSAALLSRLQGAEVLVRTHSREMRGSIVGLEARNAKVGEAVIQETWVTLWSESRSLVNLNLSEIQALELCDENLRSDLTYCLDVMLKTHKRDGKQLSIYTRGEGRRELQLSYLVEAPCWKSSYRVLLPASSEEAPFWEGWALVDNPRDEDWEDVELTLVAGLPISFRHDLYSPRYVERPEIRVEREATVGPVAVGGAVPTLAQRVARAQVVADPFAAAPCADPFAADPFGAPAACADAFGGDPFGAPMAFAAPMVATPPEVARERAAQVVAQSVGELFHYRLRHPVTVKRNQSALVPIVGQEIRGGKVVLYNAQERLTNPFAAVELTNTTGLTLEGGPLVVVDEGSYAGEAMLDTLRPDERRIVPYAVDLGTVAESQHNSRQSPVHLVRASQGVLQLFSATVQSRTYLFQNNDARDKVLWLEHPLQVGWDLYDTPQETERSATHYRFRLALPASQSVEFTVKVRRVDTNSVNLSATNAGQLAIFRSGGYFTDQAQAAMDTLTAMLNARNDLNLEWQATERRMREVQAEIERCRSMLGSLSSQSDEARLRSSYVSTMETGESDLKSLRARQEELRQNLTQKNQEIQQFCNGLNFEKML